jgi:hypothetical protein
MSCPEDNKMQTMIRFLENTISNSEDPLLKKGLGHQINIFLRANKINSVLSVHALMIFQFLSCPVNLAILLLFTCSEICTESSNRMPLLLHFSLIGRFSPLATGHISLNAETICLEPYFLHMSWDDFGTIIRITSGLRSKNTK